MRGLSGGALKGRGFDIKHRLKLQLSCSYQRRS
jgi:hypothetical protein